MKFLKLIKTSIQYPQTKKAKVLVPIFISVYLGIFLSIFQPFNLDNVEFERKYFIILGYASIAYIVIFLTQLIFSKLLKKQFLSLLYLFLYYSLNCFFIGLLSSIYNDILFKQVYFTFDSFFKFQYYIFVLCLIPFVLMLLIWSNKMKGNQIKQNWSNENLESQEITFRADNPINNFKLKSSKLVYVSAANNYVDIYYLNENQLSHKLIRNSLKNIENDLKPYPNFFRCHKGYIIDLNRAKRINKIENSYKLWLNIDNISIPVSRNKVNKVREKVREYIS